MPRPLLNLFRREMRPYVLDAGYTEEQADRLLAELTLQDILDLFIKYGPTILQVVMALIAMLAAKEAPKNLGLTTTE